MDRLMFIIVNADDNCYLQLPDCFYKVSKWRSIYWQALYFGVPILTESNELLYSPKTHLSDMEFWSRFSKITV